MSLYTEASQFISNKGKFGSLKSIIYSHYEKNKSKVPAAQVYALVAETLKYRKVLEEVIKQSKLLKIEKKVRTTVIFQ